MERTLRLSQSNLTDFLACQRRFQLRHVDRLSWPAAPANLRAEEARSRGRRFHQLLHRHFLNLDPEPDPDLADWWRTFQSRGPSLPDGRRYPELSLTVPIADQLLIGRFDLLILGDGSAHIFDWKTETRPHTEEQLRGDLQTRIYLAMLAEGGHALGQPLQPDFIRLTYWYVDKPATITIPYDDAWHAANWSALRELAAHVHRQLATLDVLPLTDDLGRCTHCAYQRYCGRHLDVLDLSDWEPDEDQSRLEPELP